MLAQWKNTYEQRLCKLEFFFAKYTKAKRKTDGIFESSERIWKFKYGEYV